MSRQLLGWRRRHIGFSFPFQSSFRFHRSSGTRFELQKEIDYRLNEDVERIERRSQTWNPTWLCWPFLLGTAFSFLALVGALVLLLYLARRDDGLLLHTTNHFSWTYGPTAVLTIFVALWRQIDYFCKALTPWQEVRQGYADPRKSVLLDYKSKLQVVSLYTAAKNGHMAVVMTILGFIILKLVTLAST